MVKDSTKTVKDPLFHIVRKDDVKAGRKIAVKIIALILAFLLASILLLASEGCNPITFLSSLFTGAFGSELSIWILLKDIAILLDISLKKVDNSLYLMKKSLHKYIEAIKKYYDLMEKFKMHQKKKFLIQNY